MEENSSEGVRCSICAKHLHSVQSRKRHEYYCKSKAKSPAKPHSRRKSCGACIKARTRCKINPHQTPKCERCYSKNVDCSFDQAPLDLDLSNSAFAGQMPAMVNPASEISWEQLFGGALPSLDFSTSGSVLQWGSNQELVQDPMWNLGNFNVPSSQSMPRINLFERKVLTKVDQMVNSHIAVGILRSFPDMMRRRESFPPFIHPYCYGSKDDGWRLPASLANATMISQMFSQRTADNRALLWQTLAIEQKRLQAECGQMSAENLLASLQALLIYILMRIMDGPTGANANEDIGPQLLTTLNQVANRLCDGSNVPITQEELQGNRQPWRDWIMSESRRRTANVLHMTLDLYNLDFNFVCPRLPMFAVAPLPASKLLWRAKDVEEWEQEWDKEIKETSIHGMLKNGDLVKLKNGYEESNLRRVEWDRWYAGADELGILAILSANLRDDL